MIQPTAADLVMICPLAEELDAVRTALASNGIPVLHLGDCDWSAEVPGGRDGVVRIVVHGPLASMGRVQGALAAKRSIETWRPKQVWLVGIAGGLGSDVHLDDVLIAEQTIDYALHKVHPRGTTTRPRSYASAGSLVAMARDHARAHCRVHFGVIASGDGVVTRRGHVQKLLRAQHNLVGVEMEAGGVAEAVHESETKVAFLHIRGVSDLADAAKDAATTKAHREPACEAAARFAVSFVARAFGGSIGRTVQADNGRAESCDRVENCAPAPLPAGRLFVEHEGAELPWVTAELAGIPGVFVLELPDPQWSSGGLATTMEIALSLPSVDALSELLAVAAQELELSHDGVFAIYQRTLAWLGLGTARFIEAIRAAPTRYAALTRSTRHHSEQLSYFAQFRDGWFLLAAQYNAHLTRLHHATVRLGLPGVPLDSSRYAAFAKACACSNAFFTVASPGTSVVRDRRRTYPGAIVRPRGRVIRRDEDTGAAWVTGLVIDNPLEESPNAEGDLFAVRPGPNIVLCELLQYHPAESPPDSYYLHSVEALHAGDMAVIHIACNW